ncbi:2-hydroxyacyl-CoA lyase 2 [Aphelenchoides besseyi]|nr:2-hydroxyacyl-CoA lyase 2 [Aphelenchoides besseyi]KAI6212063.1 2-hydroxyacyl-CoA lyase 2 [Aphelenchoides besseyi]
MDHDHHHDGCCSSCCVAPLLAVITLFVFLVKWFVGIDDMEAIKRIVANLRSRNGQHWMSNLFQVDEKSKRNGGELVASVLKAHDVTHIFTLCGGHISPILVGCENLGIKIVDTRHEVNAVFAADAVARLTQRIGVVAVTAGPGLTNTITAIKNAQMAESPLLLLGGAAPSLLKGRGALQDIDQGVLFRPLCKFTARVTKLRDIVPTVRQAIKEAQSGTPGPVFIELPIDVLYPYEIIVKEMGFVPNAKGFKKLLNAYLFTYVSRQFGGAWIERDITPLPVDVPLPSDNDLNTAAEIVAHAKKPLLLLGSQAVLPPVSPNELRKVVNDLGIPAYLGGMCRGLLGADSPVQLRQNRKDALREADVIILAGTVCDFRLGYGKALSSRAKIISINRNASQMKKNEGFFWKSTLNIQKDVASTLIGIQEKLEGKQWKAPTELLKSLKEREVAKEESNAKKASERLLEGKLNPLDLLSRLDKILPDDAILVADGGDFVGSAAYIVKPRGPLQWLDPGAFGTLGVGGGFALGAKSVYPNRPVVIIYGDGSSGYSLMEFDTFVRHKLPVVALIGNDACWSQIARDQVPWFNSAIGCELAHTSYERVGEALGARGVLLSSDNLDKMDDELRESIERGRKGESTVINAIIGKTDFRAGSISV